MKKTNAKEWSEILTRVETLGKATAKRQVKATELAALLKYILFELIRKDPTNSDIVDSFYEYLDDGVEILDEARPSSGNTEFCVALLARAGWRVGYYDETNHKFYLRDLDGNSLDPYYDRIISCNGTEYVISSDHTRIFDLNA